MSTRYVVEQGDCLSSIAHDFGFDDYRTVYEDASNADFRQLRPNPNLIYPGDVLNIPDKEGRHEDRAAGQTHSFRVRSSARFLRLQMRHNDRDPIANTPYTLTIEGDVRTGETDGDGRLSERIPKLARSAQLEIDGVVWKLNVGNLNPIDDTDDGGVSGYQARLKNLGYDPGPIDGDAGPRTEAAVRSFQEDNPPLDVDGICGPNTLAKLKEVYGA